MILVKGCEFRIAQGTEHRRERGYILMEMDILNGNGMEYEGFGRV